MDLPPGIHSSIPNAVCKLQKSIYGLKQTSRQWTEKLTLYLLSQGFQPSKNDYTMFTKKSLDSFIVLLIYVANIILASDSMFQIQQLKDNLHSAFLDKRFKHPKILSRSRGGKVSEGIMICERKYAIKLLEETGFLVAKPVLTPMVQNLKSEHNDSPLI